MAASIFSLLRIMPASRNRSEEHTSELQSRLHLVCRLLLEKKKKLPPYLYSEYFSFKSTSRSAVSSPCYSPPALQRKNRFAITPIYASIILMSHSHFADSRK